MDPVLLTVKVIGANAAASYALIMGALDVAGGYFGKDLAFLGMSAGKGCVGCHGVSSLQQGCTGGCVTLDPTKDNEYCGSWGQVLHKRGIGFEMVNSQQSGVNVQ